MEVGLAQLLDVGSLAYVEESRAFDAAMQSAAADHPPPDPSTPGGSA